MSCRHCNCNPCKCESSCDPANEPLRSMLLHFLLKQLGQPEQVCVNGEVVWVLPCGLDAGSVDFPKEADESIDCYFLRWLESLQETTIQPSFLLANNLSEGDLATKLDNLGLGVFIQAWSAALDEWALKARPTGVVVGTTDTQTLTNKELTNPGTTRQTLTDAANIDWNMNSGGCAIVTLAASRTMNAPTNLKAGATYVLEIVQGGGGTCLITWDAVFKFTNNVAPTLSTVVGRKDCIAFYCNGTNLIANTNILNNV